MSKSFKRLASVLNLEVQQGYQNKAVVGGIRQFISFWISQAEEEAVDEVDRAFIAQTADALSEYATLPGKMARSNLVQRILEKLADRDERITHLETTLTPAANTIPPPPEQQKVIRTDSSPLLDPRAEQDAPSEDDGWDDREREEAEDDERG